MRRLTQPVCSTQPTSSGCMCRKPCCGMGAMPRRPPIEQMPHQVEGTDFLRSNERAALFDEQGLGKSKQLIDAIAAQIAAGELEGAVIICPNGLKTNWAEEIRKFSDLPLAVFGAGRKARRS